MSETVRISRAPPTRVSLSWEALREAGLERIRQLAKVTWTDHNVHDPGITLLEAFCYAMTELGFRIQLDMADLLRSGEAHAPAGLVPAHRVLPCGAVTPKDLRRLLLDHHLISDVRVSTAEDGHAAGGHEALLAFEDSRWNSNTYTYPLRVPETGEPSHTLEIALPHWDEEAAEPFRRGATVGTVELADPGWRPLDEPQAYFGRLEVEHGGGGAVSFWVLLRITGALEHPVVETPGILDAATAAMATLLSDHFVPRVRGADGAVRQVERYAAARRNLGEGPVRLSAAREQEIAVSARIEVTGGTDLERLLAEILSDVDRWLTPPTRFHSLAQMRARGMEVEEVFDGPLLRHGFLDDSELAARARPSVLYTSDVLRLIMRHRRAGGGDLVAQENPGGRDIVAVTNLRLSNYVNNRPVTAEARDCLRLVEPERYRPRLSLAKSRIVFVRDEVEVRHSARRVAELFAQLPSQQRQTEVADDPSPDLPVPRGEVLPIEVYTPFQNDLPRLYGVGEAGMPESAGIERRARALQTKGYLLLFEQLLADLAAQLGGVNRFFSAEALERASYFTRPLFDLPGIEKLLKRFAPGGDWQAFVADPDNPHRLALRRAAEGGDDGRDRFLDRRNRMLDHLLARQGEETVALGQELHRRARHELAAAELELAAAELEDGEMAARLRAVNARLRAVNARLVLAKAAFLRDAPELNGARLQAFGHPLQRRPEILRLEPTEIRVHWVLAPGGEALLRSVDAFDTAAAATIAAEEAVVLAAQPAFYQVAGDEETEDRRYHLTDGPRTLGQSLVTWGTDAGAEAAGADAAARFAALRLADSLTPMERRVAHLSGIPYGSRRRLAVPIEDCFEIYDATGAPFAKGWRLWQLPGHSGQGMLRSVSHFTADSDEAADTLARESIAEVLRYGQDEWRYRIEPTPVSRFMSVLEDPEGTRIARGRRFPSRDAAEASVPETAEHLHRRYGTEVFHLVEHPLLRGVAFFEIHGPASSTQPFVRHWRLWQLPGHRGRKLLQSRQPFEAPSEARAHALAAGSIARVLRYGKNADHYSVQPTSTGTYRIRLEDPSDGAVIGWRRTTFPSREEALQAIDETAGHLRGVVEPLRLPASGDQPIEDPYSHRLSLVFPSGHAGGFGGGARTAAAPDRFRDPEFRRHVERMVRQACPAHLLPSLHWVDREAPGSVPYEASFEGFEECYFAWLESFLIPGAEPVAVTDDRNALIRSLNAIALGPER